MIDEVENLIVGAGVTGLTLGRELENHTSLTVILEKSRGLGGRMATRRCRNATFDHGAQFFFHNSEVQGDEIWTSNQLTHTWFKNDGLSYRVVNGGMTNLPKFLAKSLNVQFNLTVKKVEKIGAFWRVFTLEGKHWNAKNIFITCPLPQALQILRDSNLKFSIDLERVDYSKSIVGLVKIKSSDIGIRSLRYIQFEKDDIFSIANQMSKGVSQELAFAVRMQPHWSELHFDDSDTSIEKAIHEASKNFLGLRFGFESFNCQFVSIKKWRYCQPLTIYPKPFEGIAPGVFLLGDAFHDGGVLGGYSSALKLSRSILQTR